MSRSILLLVGIAVLSHVELSHASELMETTIKPHIGNPVTFDIQADIVFTPPKGTKVAHVWLVKPPNDIGQRVEQFEVDPKPTTQAREPLYGNELLYFRFENPDGALVIRQRMRIKVMEVRWDIDPTKVRIIERYPQEFHKWLRSERYVAADDARVKQLARRIVGNASNPFEKAKRIMLFVIEHLSYSHERCSLRANALHALIERVGHCSDYHGFATALLRAAGIPARVTYGIHPLKRRSPSHCKLEIFLAPYGWVPFDLSETDKLLDRISQAQLPDVDKKRLRQRILRWLFRGFRNNTWYRASIGTDFPIIPQVAPNPPVIRTAYIVCDDRVLPDPDPANPQKVEFAWQLVWRATPNRPVRKLIYPVRLPF